VPSEYVIVWDNNGARSEHPAGSLSDALAVARRFRTLDNRTVKVADVFGSTFHWSRSTHLKRNHWSARAVASEAFD